MPFIDARELPRDSEITSTVMINGAGMAGLDVEPGRRPMRACSLDQIANRQSGVTSSREVLGAFRHWLWIVTFLLAAAMTPRASAQETPAVSSPLTAEQWREDLRFMSNELQTRHANIFHTVSKADFERAVADLDSQIPSLARNQIIVGFMKVAAMVGDGHTRVDPRKDARFNFPSLPLKLYLFEDGLFIRAAKPQQASLVGARIEAIGGIAVSEAMARVSVLASRDNKFGPRLFVPLYLNMPDILQAVGLSKDNRIASLTVSKGGRVWTTEVRAGDVEPLWPADTDISLVTPPGWIDARKAGSAPLWLSDPTKLHRLIDMTEANALYVQINKVDAFEGETLTGLGDRILAQARGSNPKAIILDLRLNQGGDGSQRHGLVASLIKAEDFDTRLVVLTWRGTFSASQFILDDLTRLSGAIIIGEPASSKPSSYGDAYRTELPNSGISVRTSIAWWQDEQNREPWTSVDVATPLYFADYATGLDPTLEAALSYEPEPTLADVVDGKLASGPKAAWLAVSSYIEQPRHRYMRMAGAVAAGTLEVLRAGESEAAFSIAQGLVGKFPDSVEAWTILAASADATQKVDIAVEAAERVLSLDLNNRFAQELVRRSRRS